MKLNRLKSVVNQVIRESSGDSQGYIEYPMINMIVGTRKKIKITMLPLNEFFLRFISESTLQ